jgi:endonuclease I
MKKYCLLFLLVAWNASLSAQQTAYYQTALGKSGPTLKTALYNIIKGHSVQTWPLWTAFVSTDNKGNNKVWDMYSDKPGATAPYTYSHITDQCGQYNAEGECYNHEHLWPKTYFNDATPMANDLHHIVPTDGWVNNKRGSLPFGETNNNSYTSQNGSKVASSNSYAGYSGSVFEPIDSFKGDIARAMFYMSTRYQGEDNSWTNWPMANKAVLTSEAVAMLRQWHANDPVSQKEITRNNAVQAIQGNRNPFIDYPQFVECIWGTNDCTPLNLENYAALDFSILPNPAQNYLQINLPQRVNNVDITLYNVLGEKVKQSKNLRLDIKDFTPGLYFIIVEGNGLQGRKKFLKQ